MDPALLARPRLHLNPSIAYGRSVRAWSRQKSSHKTGCEPRKTTDGPLRHRNEELEGRVVLTPTATRPTKQGAQGATLGTSSPTSAAHSRVLLKQQGHTKIVLRLRERVADASDPDDGGGRGIGVWPCAIPLPNLPCVSSQSRPSHQDNLAARGGRLLISHGERADPARTRPGSAHRSLLLVRVTADERLLERHSCSSCRSPKLSGREREGKKAHEELALPLEQLQRSLCTIAQPFTVNREWRKMSSSASARRSDCCSTARLRPPSTGLAP
jgi:hypothetical protein